LRKQRKLKKSLDGLLIDRNGEHNSIQQFAKAATASNKDRIFVNSVVKIDSSQSNVIEIN